MALIQNIFLYALLIFKYIITQVAYEYIIIEKDSYNLHKTISSSSISSGNCSHWFVVYPFNLCSIHLYPITND